jgi:hypothetical protein
MGVQNLQHFCVLKCAILQMVDSTITVRVAVGSRDDDACRKLEGRPFTEAYSDPSLGFPRLSGMPPDLGRSPLPRTHRIALYEGPRSLHINRAAINTSCFRMQL